RNRSSRAPSAACASSPNTTASGYADRRARVISTSASWSATVTRSPGFFSLTWLPRRVRKRGLITCSATSWSRASTSRVSTSPLPDGVAVGPHGLLVAVDALEHACALLIGERAAHRGGRAGHQRARWQHGALQHDRAGGDQRAGADDR